MIETKELEVRLEPAVVRRNRELASRVGLESGDYESSRSFYGCPERLRAVLDRPIGEALNTTDLLVWAAAQLGERCAYLEIGVSLGRTFWVLANTLRDATLVGLDWERINPSLERQLEPVGGDEACREYRHAGNRIFYLRGDVLDEATWRRLPWRPFNLVFSDAVHQPHALAHEFRMLCELELFAPRFAALWDDLDRADDGPMTREFLRIAAVLGERFGARAVRLRVNGWFGEHEHKHDVGLVYRF